MESGSGSKVYQDILFLLGAIINEHGKEIQTWDTKINFKDAVEAVIYLSVILLSRSNFLLMDCL